MKEIDLNSDLGEHPGETLDEQIMPFLSSCNIACGGHIGDEVSVREAILLAMKYDVAIGAHPSYPDREGFGRTVIDIPENVLAESLRSQILLLKNQCAALGATLHHIKPHGALYNQAAKDASLSKLICQIIGPMEPSVKLYGLAHSITEQVAEAEGIDFAAEGFADRRYEDDRSLMSRQKEGAVLTAEEAVLQQVEEMTLNQRVFATSWVPLHAQTICLHSDTQGAVHLAGKIRAHLEKNEVRIAAV